MPEIEMGCVRFSEERGVFYTNLYRDDKDKQPIEKCLQQKVMDIMSKEMVGRGPKLYERGFDPMTLHTDLFDFIRLEGGRFFMMLYSPNVTDDYHPRSPFYQDVDFYPFGTKIDEICETFHKDLEEGKMARKAVIQVSAKTGGNNKAYYSEFFPCCVEVTKQEDIEEITALAQQVVELGLRSDIITGTTESMGEILARVENDDSLDFDYR